MTTFDKVLVTALAPVVVFFLWGFFVVVPASLVAEYRCLNQGYPEAKVNFLGKGYCVGYDGAIFPIVRAAK